MNEYVYEMTNNVTEELSDEEVMYMRCNELLRHNRKVRCSQNWFNHKCNEREEI